MSNCDNIDLKGADLSNIEDLKLPSRIKSLEGTKLPKKLDLSNYDNIDLKGADLSNIEDLKLPSRIKSLEGTKLPKNLTQLDLSNCDDIDLKGADLSNIEDLKLPSRIKSLEGTKLPKKLDLSECSVVIWKGADLSNVEELTLRSVNFNDTKLPTNLKYLNVSSCYDINLQGVELKNCTTVKLGKNCNNADFSEMKGNIEFCADEIEIHNTKLPSTMTSLDLSSKCIYISEVDLSNIEELKLPEIFLITDDFYFNTEVWNRGYNDKYAVISPDCKLDNVKKLDASLCKNLDLRNWDLTKIEELKLPKNFDVSKLPEGILEKNPAVAKAVKEAHGEVVETIAKSCSIEDSVAKTTKESLKDTMKKDAVKAGACMGKVVDGMVSGISKADNAVNQAIDTVIDKGSKALNNTSVGKAYTEVSDAVSKTKVVKAVEKATAEVGEKVAQSAVGKAVTKTVAKTVGKTVAKTSGTAVVKSLVKKLPIVSLGAGLYFAYDRIKDGDWKGACGEVASGALGCFPGLGTAASAAIDVGLAAKDISEVVSENKSTEATTEEKNISEVVNQHEAKSEVVVQQGQLTAEAKPRPQTSSQQINAQVHRRMLNQGR